MPEITPIRLRCEYRVDLLGVDTTSPRLSWILEAEERGQRQSAYQILAASREEDLETGESLLWDSGKVSSEESVNIPYEGEELRSGSCCVWKVRVWDGLGNPSPYSEPAAWEMGLLKRSDWAGQWMGLGKGVLGDVEPPTGEKFDEKARGLTPSPYLRKEFELEEAVRRARLYATAKGVYELHLNGQKVGDDVLAPGWTDYNRRIQYQTHDVTEMLAEGLNALGAIIGDGWFAGFYGMDPKRTGAHYGTHPQILVQLDLEYDDGTKESVVSDVSWKSSLGPIEFSDLLMGESYDARREMPGWDEPGFGDSEWVPVSIEDIGDARLVAEPNQGVRVTQEVKAKDISQPKSGTYVFDFGQNMVGWVRLKVRGKTGDRMTLRHAEALNLDGTIYTSNLRTARQTDSYVLKGEGEEVFEPHFTFHGFRYVEVTGYPGEPSLDAITGRVVHSAAPSSGSFECSMTMVNRLQSNILWGQRGNFLSVPTDCPQRDERLGWMGDAQVFVRTACFNMDVSAFFTKWMVDVEDAQSPEGAFPDVAPLLSDLRVLDLSNGAPAWGDAGIIVPWTVYRNYGDTRIVERHYDAMGRWMEYLREANRDLLRTERLGNNYGDWLSPKGDYTPKDLLATAYWAYDAKLMAEMAGAIRRQDDASEYEELFRGIKEAFIRAYVSSEGRVKGETQTCYALALHMDLLPAELREAAAEYLVEAIEREDWHLSTGFIGVGYLCPVLTETGHADVAYRLLNNETYPSWGYTIRQGATTIWERWDGWTEEKGFQSPNMNSFNHYSLGSVGEWLYRHVAGIDQEPRSSGYKHIIIHPHPGGGLSSARAEYDSVRGRIASEWEIVDGTFQLRVAIPTNTTATVHVPSTDGGVITESNRPLEQAEGVELLSLEDGEAVVAVGSGRYEFVGSVG